MEPEDELTKPELADIRSYVTTKSRLDGSVATDEWIFESLRRLMHAHEELRQLHADHLEARKGWMNDYDRLLLVESRFKNVLRKSRKDKVDVVSVDLLREIANG